MNRHLFKRLFPALAFVAAFGFAVESLGCNVPVFRYALERWERDEYQLIVAAKGEIRAEPGAILPGTRIIEQESKALARAETRAMASATAQQQIRAMRENRAQLKEKREAMAPLLRILGC